jgi:hypothetical protein
MPEMASTNLYLIHGLLACSALHLADLQPSLQQELTARAVSHHDQALPLFRSALSSVSDHNCHAVYVFSRLLVIFAFASQQIIENFLLAQKDPENDASSCLHLIHGGCSALITFRHAIETGPLKWLIPPEEYTSNSAYCEDFRLSSLSSLSSLEPDDSWRGTAPAVYLDAFLGLRKAFCRTYTRGASLPVWDVVQMWPARFSDGFITLLNDDHPGALVLLAHYCILLKQFESYWFIKKYAARLLFGIYGKIGKKWHRWISWPLDDIGIEH